VKYVNFLFHIYQPPTQDPRVLDRIVEECYGPLSELFLELADLRFTLNIAYSLVEQLQDRHPEVLDRLHKAWAAGTLELTATAAYHPILPLIPPEEARRQLQINLEGLQGWLGAGFAPQGVFPPEMAIDGGLAGLLAEAGYRWAVADDGILAYFERPIPRDWVCSFAGIAVFLRSNFWSNRFARADATWVDGTCVFRDLRDGLAAWTGDRDGYLIVSVDGETFRQHHKRLGAPFLRQIFAPFRDPAHGMRLTHIGELHANPAFAQRPGFIPPGSWSFDPMDMERGDHFAWWKAQGNTIQADLWALLDLVRNQVERTGGPDLRGQMDRACYSDTFWYASVSMFNPGQVYKGASLMMEILQAALALTCDTRSLERGERLLRSVVTACEAARHRRRRRG